MKYNYVQHLMANVLDVGFLDMEGNQRESYWPQRELHASPFAKHLIKNAQQKKENIVKPET